MPSRFVHTSLTSTENWQGGKRAIDESADAAAGVDVLISSPPVCLITVVSGLSLLNCIQDHHVSLWWCECGKQRENQSQGTLLSLCHTNVQTHTYMYEYYSFSYLQYSLYHILSSLVVPHPHTCNLTHTHTHRSTAFPVPSLTWCEQKAWIYPLWEPTPLLSPPHFSNTQPVNMYYVVPVSVSHSGNEAVLMCSIFCVCVCVCVWERVSHVSNVKCSVTKKKCNEGGPASSKEDSVQGRGADSISFVGAMKWW